MIFANVTTVQQIAKGIRLTGPKKTDVSLERFHQSIYFLSNQLTVRNNVYLDDRDQKPPSVSTSITATLTPSGFQAYAFHGTEFLGRIEKYTAQCFGVDEKSKAFIQIWKPDHQIHDVLEMHILLHLEAAVFKEIFHPIWLRQAKSVLDLNVRLTGYQWGPEAAFSDVGDIHNLVFEAENNDLCPKLSSIGLNTDIQGQRPPEA